MIDFLLMYEFKAREFDNICLLAAELERRGYIVGVLNRFDFKRHNDYLFTKRPRVICTVAFYNNQSLFSQAYQFSGNTKKIVNFRWEQLFSAATEEDLTNAYHYPTGVAKKVVHLCWGEKQQQQLLKRNVEKAPITGPIQMDFLNYRFDSIYEPSTDIRTRYHISTKYILLYISSFAYASYSEEMIEHDENLTGYPIKECAHSERISRAMTLKILEIVIERREDITVIYRSHPSELCSDEVLQFGRKHNRFMIINDHSVKQWIKVSDYIVTWISTSIVEAFFAKKPVIVLRPNDIPAIDNPVIYDECEYCSSADDILEKLQQSTIVFPLNIERIMEYYDERNETLSYVRTADFLEEVLHSEKYDLDDDGIPAWRIIKTGFAACVKRILYNTRAGEYICTKWKPFKRFLPEFNMYRNFKCNIDDKSDIRHRIEEMKNAIK